MGQLQTSQVNQVPIHVEKKSLPKKKASTFPWMNSLGKHTRALKRILKLKKNQQRWQHRSHNIRYAHDSNMNMKGQPPNLKDASSIKEYVHYKKITKGEGLVRENK
mgnify:CR=1 FL=1